MYDYIPDYLLPAVSANLACDLGREKRSTD